MTAPSKRLSEVFDKGLEEGLKSLSSDERDLFLIQDFIIELEMNGLSGYFYNRLPTRETMLATANAMHRYGLVRLEMLFREALELFRNYTPPDNSATWGEILQRYDPKSRLDGIAEEINAIEDYGLASSTIS